MQLGWIEAAIRYVGRFAASEKRAYQEVFDLSEPSVSRRQARFVDVIEDACGCSLFERSDDTDTGRLRSGALFLRGDVALPPHHVFDRVPSAERWLEDALGHECYNAYEIPRAAPEPAVLRALVRAIQDKRPLGILYQSRRGQSRRHMSPHVIVKVAGRMHVRGWDHKRNNYADFVITRIVRAWPVEDAFVAPSDDKDWARFTHIVIEDCRDKDDAVREGIRRDFGLDGNGKRILRVRKAIAPYLVDNTNDGFESPVRISEKHHMSG